MFFRLMIFTSLMNRSPEFLDCTWVLLTATWGSWWSCQNRTGDIVVWPGQRCKVYLSGGDFLYWRGNWKTTEVQYLFDS
ncbi:unnamed protein product, partial [Linum tenue]